MSLAFRLRGLIRFRACTSASSSTAVLLALLAAAVAEAPPRAQVAHARPVVAAAPVAIAAAPVGERRLVASGGIEEAQRYARRRGGTIGFAVAGAGRRIRGVNVNHRFYSASVVKAMLALAVVRAAPDRDLTAEERGLLHPMITVSDNAAASTVYARVGADALNRIARAAGMTRFSVGFNWADALLTAHDQARLFLRIDRLAPRRHRGYLRGLLGGVVSWQRWGIAPVGEAARLPRDVQGRLADRHLPPGRAARARRAPDRARRAHQRHRSRLRPRDAGRHRGARAVAAGAQAGQPDGCRRSLNSSVPLSSTVTTPATLGGSMAKSANAIGAEPASSIAPAPSR